MSNQAARAREARNLADLYEKQGGHATVVEMLREHALTLSRETGGSQEEIERDAARYRRLAVMRNNDWVSFDIPSSNPAYPLEPHNRKPFLDDLLDKAENQDT